MSGRPSILCPNAGRVTRRRRFAMTPVTDRELTAPTPPRAPSSAAETTHSTRAHALLSARERRTFEMFTAVSAHRKAASATARATRIKNDVVQSSFRIVTVAAVRARVAFEGTLRLTKNVSLDSRVLSPLIVTVIEAVPAENVTVPDLLA